MAEGGALLLAGVGGQGVVMASSVVAAALLAGGYDVKQSEVHGMAQRGGAVVSHLRFGAQVASPLLALGGADAVVAFEWAEALRWLSYLRPGGTLVASVARIVPITSCADRLGWTLAYPAVDPGAIADRVGDARLVDARRIAAGLGHERAANSVLLGILSTLLEVPERAWISALEAGVPSPSLPANLRAFAAGRATALAPPAPWYPPAPRAPRALPSIEITAAWCKGCDLCVRFCPQRCLELDRGRADQTADPSGDRATVVAVRPQLCTGCRLCELLCPDFAIEITHGVSIDG